MREATICQRILIFITSSLSLFMYMGIYGVISRLKKPMSEDLDLSQQELGLIDGLKFISSALGFLFLLLYSPKHPKKYFLIASIATAMILNIFAASVYFSHYSQEIITVCMFLAGLFRSCHMIPLLIVNQYFDSKGEDKKLIAIWYAICALGSAFSVIFCEILLIKMKLSWSSCIFIFSLLFLVPTISLSLIAEEVVIEEQDQQNKNISTLDALKQFIISYYWKKPSNFFHTLQHSWNTQLSSSIELWFPYYFLSLGFKAQASLILVAYSISMCVSSPIFQCMISPFESFLQMIMTVMLLLNICIIFCFTLLEEAVSYFPLYLGLSFLSGFLLSGPKSRVYSWELRNRTKNNKQLFLTISTVQIITTFGIGIDMVVIGYLMREKLRNFLYVLLFISFMTAANQIFRNLLWAQDYLKVSKEQVDERNLNRFMNEEE